MLLHSHNTDDTHQMANKLLLILTHLHQSAMNVPYITQLSKTIANLGDDDDMNRSTRVDILEGTALED